VHKSTSRDGLQSRHGPVPEGVPGVQHPTFRDFRTSEGFLLGG